MSKLFVAMVFGLAISAGVRADDPKPAPAKTVTVSEDSDCHVCHGFFHPFTKFWTHTVGGNVGDGMKCGARHVEHGIAGGSKD